MARALTRRQREVFDFLVAHIAEKGYAPSLSEIGERFQLTSLATVHKHLQNLATKGWIRRLWNRSRSTGRPRSWRSTRASGASTAAS